MYYEDDPVPHEVQFNTASLFSKWGFGDGDDLEWLPSGYDERTVRHEVIKQKVMPLILVNHPDAKLVFIASRHNSSRIEFIDGKDVSGCWYEGYESHPDISPSYVMVPGSEILRIAKELPDDE